MSSTNRGGKRSEADYYPTPAWCVHRLLERYFLPAGRWLEPAAGDGAIIRAVNAVRSDVSWEAIDIRSECLDSLRLLAPGRVHSRDYLASRPILDPALAVIITNPPFSRAIEFAQHSLAINPTGHLALLLRLNFLGSEVRQPWLRENMPSVYVLPNRPSFAQTGKTDSPEYAWFVWGGFNQGRVQVLDLTPNEVRKAQRANLKGDQASLRL